MEDSSTQLTSTAVRQLDAHTQLTGKHQLDSRLADAASHAIRAGRLLLKSKPSGLSGDDQPDNQHDYISTISKPYPDPFLTDGVSGSGYDSLLSDIIRGYEDAPNMDFKAMNEFSSHGTLWTADAQLRLTPTQLSLLEIHFEKQPKPGTATKRDISEATGIPLEKVTYWFQNRRAKERLRARGQKETGPSDLHYALKAEQFLETEEYKSGLVGYYEPDGSADDCPSLSSGSTVSSRNPSARSSPGDIYNIMVEPLDLSTFGVSTFPGWPFVDDEDTEKYAGAAPTFARRFRVSKPHLLERSEKCPIMSCEYHIRGFVRRYDKDRHMCTHFKTTLYCGFCSKTTPFSTCEGLLQHLVSAHGALLDLDIERKNLGEKELFEYLNDNKSMVSTQAESTDDPLAKCTVCSTMFNPRGMWEHLKACIIEKVIEDSKAMTQSDGPKPRTEVNASDSPILTPTDESKVAKPSIPPEPQPELASVEHDLPNNPRKDMVGSLQTGNRPRTCSDIPNSPTTSNEIHTSDEETDWTEDLSPSSPPSEDEISEVRPVLSPLKQQVVNRLMREFNRQFNSNFGVRSCNGGGNAQSNGTRTPSPLARSGAIVGSRKRKGSRGNSTPPPNDGNGEDPNKRRRPDTKLDNVESPMLRFACPYYKRNPRRHQTFTSCRDPGFTTVARLKEHLYRRHLLPIQCNRCCAIFENESQLRDHQRDAQGCEIQEQMPLEGFDKAQERKLKSKKRSMGCQTEEDKWKSVYRILFPDDTDEDMPSPYCEYITRSKSPDSDRSANIARFQEFSRLELPRLVRRTLEVAVEKEAQPLEERLKDQLVDIVRECQSQLFSMFQGSAHAQPTKIPIREPDDTPIKPDITPDPLVGHDVLESSVPLASYELPLVGPSGFNASIPFPSYDFFGSITTPEKPSPPAMEPATDSPESLSSLDIPETSLTNQAFPENEYLDLGKFDGVATGDSSFSYDTWPVEWGFEDPLVMYGENADVS